jgi:hypothetical protein
MSHSPDPHGRRRVRRPGGLLALILCAAFAAPGAVAAEPDVVYVTDELRLGLFRTEETAGRPEKMLVSGTRLDILERALMSIRVRTEDGDEGWVKTAYVVDEEPARRRVARLETAQQRAAAELEARNAEIDALEREVETLNASLTTAEQGVADLPAVRAENETLKARLEAGGIQVPLLWLIVAVLTSLLMGILLGYRWLDRKVRRHFGGIRVY